MFAVDFERDPSKLQTNAIFLSFSGALYDGSWKSVFTSVFRIFFLLAGFSQYLLKTFSIQGLLVGLAGVRFILLLESRARILLIEIILPNEDDTQLALIEALHWVIVFLSVSTMVISCLAQSSRFFKMQAMVKSGLYDYEGNLSEEQIIARATANRDIIFSTKVFSASCYAALVGSYLKAPLVMRRFATPYPQWFPYKINSYGIYFPSMIWVLLTAEAMVTCVCANWVCYVTMAGHLIGQFKILNIAIKEIDALAKGEEAQQKVMARIKCCVQHHLLLIDYFFDLQYYFNFSLLVAAFSTGLILCTLGYLVISGETSLATTGALLLVFIPELCVAGYYCVLGQKIADVTEEVGITLYNLEWYTMPLPVQRDLLMMLVGSKKIRQLTGLGLHEFSIKGLSEILQASFTYFNMLSALSGGK